MRTSARLHPLSQARLAARPCDRGTADERRRTFSSSPITASSLPGETVAEVADRIERVCEALSAPARAAPQVGAEELGAIVAGHRLSSAARSHRPRCRARPEKPERSRGSARSIPTTWCSSGRVSWKAPSLGGRLRAPPRRSRRPPLMMALAGSRRGSPSFDVEERGSDGAVSRGCRGPHSREGADTRADMAPKRKS